MGLLFEGKEYSKDEVLNLPINELIKICKAYNLTYAEFGPFLYKNRHVLWLKFEEKVEGKNATVEEISFHNSILNVKDEGENTTDSLEKAIEKNSEKIETTEIEQKEVELKEQEINAEVNTNEYANEIDNTNNHMLSKEELKEEEKVSIDISSWTNILEVSQDSHDDIAEEKETSDAEFKYSYSELQVLDYITLANSCVDAGLIASEENDDYYSYTKLELITMLNDKYQLYTNLEATTAHVEEDEIGESIEENLETEENISGGIYEDTNEDMDVELEVEKILIQPYKMIKYMPENKENKFLIVEAVIGDKPIYRQPTELEIGHILNDISLYKKCNK